MELLDIIENEGVIAIVRGVYRKECERLCEALLAGGIRLVEVTFDQSDPSMWIETQKAISRIAEVFEGRIRPGAGTVTSTRLAEAAMAAGARYVISPDVNPEVIERTKELGLISIPGALTPTEIAAARRHGADIVKLFPAGELGCGYLKAVKAPLSDAKLMAVGGVNADNAGQFVKAGAVGVGVGGSLVDKNRIRSGDFDSLTKEAERLVAAVKAAKEDKK